MSESIAGLRAALCAAGCTVYETSPAAAGNTICAVARDARGKFLAVGGDASAFSGEASRICRVASAPSRFGILRSMTTTSGSSSPASRTAESPSVASPTVGLRGSGVAVYGESEIEKLL